MRILNTIILLMLTCVAGLGQTTFKGLTPGKSTRAEVERVMGRPLKNVSETLAEYAPIELKLPNAKVTLNNVKIFVQYRDNSASGVVERIELIPCPRTRQIEYQAGQCKFWELESEFDRIKGPGTGPSGNSLDSVSIDRGKQKSWFGFPRYMLSTSMSTYSDGASYFESRWAFYSKELYEAAAPTGNCLGTLRGEWDTNLGPMNITRVDGFGRVRGTFGNNNGSFTGVDELGNITGEWKDNTGGGTMYLGFVIGFKEFTGSWKRTSGTGPQGGVWEGRCIEAKSE